MGHTALTLVVLACCCLAHALTIWPQPYSLVQGTDSAWIDPSMFKITTNVSSSVFTAAIDRYYNSSTQQGLFFPFEADQLPSGSNPTVTHLSLLIGSSDENLQLGVDESYTLSMTASSPVATVEAATIFGGMRALETFSQVIDFDESTFLYTTNVLPLSVQDMPRFEWRGLLIDSARHYLELSTILHTIDAMSYSKLNTLHWHVVDAQSFPMQTTTYPNLAGKGAYAPSATYTVSELAQVKQYALERGIRVLLEFDIPGHAYSWGLGYPQLTVYCANYAANVNNIPLDPTQNFTYAVIQSVLAEVTSVMLDDYIHIGGDEVVTGCWMENTTITSWMSDHGMSSPYQLLQYFEDSMVSVVRSINKTAVVWEDLFDNGIQLSLDTIIEVWSDHDTLGSIVKAGYQGITAYGWYLNDQVPIPGQEVSQWVDTWKTFYGNDPFNGLDLTQEEQNLVKGGEAAMWGEQCDSVNFDSRVWPRTCAVAERLWSQQTVTDVNAATSRLVEHRCRLARRNVGAGPIAPDYCALPSGIAAYRKRLHSLHSNSEIQ